MTFTVEPLRFHSLKEACVLRLEEHILSGEWKAGQKLPPERELASRLGISRPVLHEALVELSTKGLVNITPRKSITVNDFRKSGSVAILSSLLAYKEGFLEPAFVQSLLGMRLLLEQETAALAARFASKDQVTELEALVRREHDLDAGMSDILTRLDFEFHLLISMASGNQVYPLIINSFRGIYTHFTGLFFQSNTDPAVIAEVHEFHRQLVAAIKAGQPKEASAIMRAMLLHGEKLLNLPG